MELWLQFNKSYSLPTRISPIFFLKLLISSEPVPEIVSVSAGRRQALLRETCFLLLFVVSFRAPRFDSFSETGFELQTSP